MDIKELIKHIIEINNLEKLNKNDINDIIEIFKKEKSKCDL